MAHPKTEGDKHVRQLATCHHRYPLRRQRDRQAPAGPGTPGGTGQPNRLALDVDRIRVESARFAN
jgi:hypothetical protein